MKTKLSLLATGMLLAAVNAGFSQPVITNQPGTLATALGTTATFTVGARGSGPLAYQWQKNLSDLPGRRDASLALTNVQFSDQADYRVVVSDTGGSVTSAAARLYVMSFTAVTSRVVVDSFDDNRLTGWTSYVGGTRIETNQQLTVRGYWPGVITYDPPSTAADAFLPRNWSVSDGQTLEWRVDLVGMNQGATAVILELLNSTWDGVYPLFRGRDFVHVNKYFVNAGGPAHFLHEQAPIPNTNVVLALAFTRLEPDLILTARILDKANPNAVLYERSVVDTPNVDPTLTEAEQQAASGMHLKARSDIQGPPWTSGAGVFLDVWQYNYDGSQPPAEATFDNLELWTYRAVPAPPLSVTCAPDPVAFDCDLTYTLTVRNETLRAATGVVVTDTLPPDVRFVSATASQGSCAQAEGVVSCDLGSLAVLSNATITIVVQPTRPGALTNLARLTATEPEFAPSDPITHLATARFIADQPQSQTVSAASNVTFRVRAPCSPETTYQWQRNGFALPGATADTLTLTNVQVPDEGTYTVLVTHPTASVLSDPANLSILMTPLIVQPPLSQTVVEGGNVTLSAVISGSPPPFLFQWRRGMFTVLTNIVQNERTCFFTLANVQLNQGGQYRLHITNAASPNWTSVGTTFNLTVLADTDADGLPDVWETAYGLNPASANHGTADDDADGLTNEQEYTAGTDPTNALGYLKVDSITLAEGGSAIALGFLALSNKTYTVQYRDSLDSGEWTRLADVVAVSSNRVAEISDPGAPTAARRFYRLVTPRAP